ncbi:hypothetical protein RhiJN_10265 [Ceratobasidium sp. AG-Ba]|nr:hypothetical protein RhiJN_10265 [Ceratobasidium sp. AG-Ba]QRW11019.1 hypothetical protein RhiLY_10018 [Ceratobasidium sp. AG-Ba]
MWQTRHVILRKHATHLLVSPNNHPFVMADAVFVDRSGRSLRIHLDMGNIPQDAVVKLGQEIEAGGGDVTFNANKSDVLVVNPMHPHAFDKLIGDRPSDQRPPVVLAFWVPLCRISGELVWFNHAHWDSVYLPYEQMSYPHVPIGLRLYDCFLAGRATVSVSSSELAATAPELVAKVILKRNSQDGQTNQTKNEYPTSSLMADKKSQSITNSATSSEGSTIIKLSTAPLGSSQPMENCSSKAASLVTPTSSPTTATPRALTKRSSVLTGLKILTKGNSQTSHSSRSNCKSKNPHPRQHGSFAPTKSNDTNGSGVENTASKNLPQATWTGTSSTQSTLRAAASPRRPLTGILEPLSKPGSGRWELPAELAATTNPAVADIKASSGLQTAAAGASDNTPCAESSSTNEKIPSGVKAVVSGTSIITGEDKRTTSTSPTAIGLAPHTATSSPPSSPHEPSTPVRASFSSNLKKTNGVRFRSPVVAFSINCETGTSAKEVPKSRPSLASSPSPYSEDFPPAPGRKTPPPALPEILPETSTSGRRQWLRDDEYIINFMNWVFKQDPKASAAEIILDISKRLPHHSNDSWRRRFATYEGEKFIHRIPVLNELYHKKISSVNPKIIIKLPSITPSSSQSATPSSRTPEPPRAKSTMPQVPVAPSELEGSLKFTEEEDQFVIDYMKWWFEQDPEASTYEIMEDIALLIPRHSASSWKARYRSLEDSKYMVVPQLLERLTNRSSGPKTVPPTSLDLILVRQRNNPDYKEPSSDDDEYDWATGTKRRKIRRQSQQSQSRNRNDRKKPRVTM